MACEKPSTDIRHKYLPEENNVGNPEILYKRCIGNYYDGYWAGIINYYPKYEKGIYPYNCGYFDLPAKFVEVMELVHNLINENKITNQKKQAQLNGKRSSKR